MKKCFVWIHHAITGEDLKINTVNPEGLRVGRRRGSEAVSYPIPGCKVPARCFVL